MGRPKKPVELQQGRMSNDDKRIRKDQEEKMKHGNDELIAPDWLDKDAKKEFVRVIDSLKKIDCVGNLDFAMVAIYSDAYSNYVNLTKDIQKYGVVEEYTNAKGATNKVISSYVQAQHKYVDVIMKCSSKLGLSVSDRLRLVIPVETEEDELLSILKS